jgi:hypothetical protein
LEIDLGIAHVKENQTSEQGARSCFVIGPIGDRQAAVGSEERLRYEESMRVWDYVIKPACDALGIDPVRADMIAEPGEITDQVCRRLRDDDLVIADVTGGNANVLYELGLRHTTNKPTVQLGEKDKLPFDITVVRTIQFVRSETGLVEARESLQKTISAVLERGGNPVTATRVWNEVDGNIAEVPLDTKAEEDADGPGFLDMVAEAEEAAPMLTEVMEELTMNFESFSDLTEDAMKVMETSNERGQGTGGRLRIAQQLADNLDGPATRMEQLAGDFVGQLDRMAPGISYLISRIEDDPSSLHADEGAKEFSDTMKELSAAAAESLPQVDVLADVTYELGRISNRLRPVSRRMSSALRKIAGTSRTIQDWGRRLDDLDSEAA